MLGLGRGDTPLLPPLGIDHTRTGEICRRLFLSIFHFPTLFRSSLLSLPSFAGLAFLLAHRGNLAWLATQSSAIFDYNCNGQPL